MRKVLILPTLLLAGLAVAALSLVAATSRSTTRELEHRIGDVRKANALAFRISQLASRDEQDLLAYRFGGDRSALERIAAAEEEIDRIAREIGDLDMSPRGRALWREVLTARAVRAEDRDAVIRNVASGTSAEADRAYRRWRLSASMEDALVADLSVHNLRRLERAVAELDRVRSRSTGLLVAVLGVSAALVLSLSFLSNAWVVRPIRRMTEAARRIASERAAVVVPGGERGDELGVLARAITVTAADLVRANAELARSVHARDEFLSIASHELKTPLTALRLQLQNGQRRWAERHSEPAPAWVAAALRQLDRLEALVAELLDLARIRAGRFQLRPERVDLSDLVRGVAERMREVLGRAGNTLDVAIEEGIVLECDPTRLEQVVANLVANAGQHAPGTRVTVRALSRAGRAEIQVEDEGPGIPEEARERIFEAYEKVDGRSAQGLGLGLYIARQIVEAHGGAIAVVAAPSGGALFTVELPASPPASASAPQGTPAAARSRSPANEWS
ncbi:MAG TPA: ATP-binding protein [Anaeromyxobacter sp.]|nr:ATP-binding protein [Anaeromyxobacter sp.]